MPGNGRPTGANVVGYFKAEAGVGEAARLLLETLRAAEIPYAVVSHTSTVSRQDDRFDDEGSGPPAYDVSIVCVNADELARFVSIADSSLFSGRHVIGMWWWEVEEFPERMASVASLVDEIWVGSRHTAEAVARAVDVPVHVCPPPIVPPTPASFGRRQLGLPEGCLFLFAFDFLSVFERKNPLAVVDAFARAFRPEDGANLVLRAINGSHRPDERERLEAAIAHRPDIRLVEGYLERDVQHALVASCDAYVSLHRAEGFGLTLAEAMALGKPVVGTAYSGNLEFMDETNSYLVPHRLVPIGEGHNPYPPTARWAEPDVDEAARLMRRIFERPDEARAVGERAARAVAEAHSPAARAPLLVDLIAAAERVGGASEDGRAARAAELVRRWHGLGSVPHEERAALYLSGGPKLLGSSPRGRLGNLYRRAVLATLRHYRHFESERSARLVALARAQRDELDALRRRIDRELTTVARAGDAHRTLPERHAALLADNEPVLRLGDVDRGAGGGESLAACEDGSLGALHCEDRALRRLRDGLPDFFGLAAGKLRPGGVVVCDGVNPHSFPAFRSAWVDPVAGPPIFPEALVLTFRQLGYAEASVEFVDLEGNRRERNLAERYLITARSSAGSV